MTVSVRYYLTVEDLESLAETISTMSAMVSGVTEARIQLRDRTITVRLARNAEDRLCLVCGDLEVEEDQDQ